MITPRRIATGDIVTVKVFEGVIENSPMVSRDCKGKVVKVYYDNHNKIKNLDVEIDKLKNGNKEIIRTSLVNIVN